MTSIRNTSRVLLGVVMTIFGFDPLRKKDGEYVYLSGLDELLKRSPVEITGVQLPLFPPMLVGEAFSQVEDLFAGLRQRVDEVMAILMFEEDPLEPANRQIAVDHLYNGLMAASKLGVQVCSATSLEAWMKGTLNKQTRLTGDALTQAVLHLIDIHVEAISRANKGGCNVHYLDLEYLRPIEFTHFTDMQTAYRVVRGINAALGRSTIKVRLLDDSAHAVNSGLSAELRMKTRRHAAANMEHGTFHASEPTTRGRIGFNNNTAVVDELRSAARDGRLQNVFVELFVCDGPETQPMRDNIDGYGIDTYDGDIITGTIDSLVVVQNEINELVRTGVLAAR